MRWLMVSSFALALLFLVVPLPFESRWWRPELVALLVVFWATFQPQYFGVFSAWLVGLLLDIVSLSPLGLHTLGLMVIAYISYLSYQRVRSYAIWQQAAWVFVLVGIYRLFDNWANSSIGINVDTNTLLLTALITAFLWPLLVVVLEKLIRVFRLS